MGGAYANYFRCSVRDVMYDVTDAMRRDWLQVSAIFFKLYLNSFHVYRPLKL